MQHKKSNKKLTHTLGVRRMLLQYLNSQLLLLQFNSQQLHNNLLNTLDGCGIKRQINGFLIQTINHLVNEWVIE